MKRAVSAVLTVVLLLTMLPISATGAGTTEFSAELSIVNSEGFIPVGDDVSMGLFITPKTGDKQYNAYYFTLTYDNVRLAFVSAVFTGSDDKETPVVAEANGGLLTIAGYGEDRTNGGIKLTFTVLAPGDSSVTLKEAFIDRRSNAQKDANPAEIVAERSTAVIHGGGCQVTLPASENISGAAFAAIGRDYTFTAAPAGYAYHFSATMNGVPAAVVDNKDGTYTVRNVTGELEIILDADDPYAPRVFSAEVTGSGRSEVYNAGNEATYGQDYTFRLVPAAGYQYVVSATVGGQPVSCTGKDGLYTIGGADILGDIVITVTKVTGTDTTKIVFVGSGAEDVAQQGGVQTAVNGSDFTFSIAKKEGYVYTVSAAKDGTAIPVTESADGSYTIAGEKITGGIITVTVTRTVPTTVSVTAVEFLKRDGESLVLLQAVPRAQLAEYEGLYYDKTSMLWSDKYNAYVWLVMTSDSMSEAAEEAKARITIGTKAHTLVTHSGDVNGTGVVDINDAQLLYDLYQAKSAVADISSVEAMQPLLNGDVNHNGMLDTGDARAVVFLIAKR